MSSFLLFCIIRGCWSDVYLRTPLSHLFKVSERLPKIASELRQSAPAEDEQHDRQDQDKLRKSEAKHDASPAGAEIKSPDLGVAA